MSLRAKSLLFVVMVNLAILTIIILFMQKILTDSFRELETKNIHEHVERAVNAFERELKVLTVTNKDWATWDSAFQFAKEPTPEFITDSLSEMTFINNSFNYIIFLNDRMEVVFQRGLDLNTAKRIQLPIDLFTKVTKESVFTNIMKTKVQVSGLMQLKSGSTYIVASPILPNSGEGEPSGILIMGRFLNQNEVNKISTNVKLDVMIHQGTDPRIPRDELINSIDPIVVYPISSDKVIGSTLVKDIFGQDTYSLSVTVDRPIYLQGQRNVLYLITFMVTISVVYAATILFSIEHLILSKLASLMKQIKKIKTSRDFSLRIDHNGKDELDHLMEEFNRLMEKVELTQEQLHHLASHDPLTQLPNRLLFDQYLRKALINATLTECMVAVMFLDLDGFKKINDLFGHSAGDQLLQEITARLTKVLKGYEPYNGIVTRHGGDEFLIILSEIKSRDNVAQVAKQLVSTINEQIGLKDQVVNVSASIGISMFPIHAENGDSLIKKADEAMYLAKEKGKNQYVFSEETTTKNFKSSK